MSIKHMAALRDEDGFWTHPDYFVPANGNEYAVPGEFSAWLRQHNLESFTLSLESDAAASEVAENYFDGELGGDISSWQPSKPQGKGWFIGSIHDTEDGPYCIWLRPVMLGGHK
ncbi:hypothetical protein [Pantoea vagans]|uniref:hypothetical protein n=1 Tax=Pantoea vagans TaxID=470934 RepID=UPI0010938A80|nr:hypothetical protein [Pantoea vagans]QCA04899.1 hypothetical protein EGO56_12350 [Pantoea vagans]